MKIFQQENLTLTVVILYYKIKIQQIAPGVTGLLIQAGFLTISCSFQNASLLLSVPGQAGSKHPV